MLRHDVLSRDFLITGEPQELCLSNSYTTNTSAGESPGHLMRTQILTTSPTLSLLQDSSNGKNPKEDSLVIDASL